MMRFELRPLAGLFVFLALGLSTATIGVAQDTHPLIVEADSIVASSPSDLSPYGLQNPSYRIAVESDQTREVLGPYGHSRPTTPLSAHASRNPVIAGRPDAARSSNTGWIVRREGFAMSSA